MNSSSEQIYGGSEKSRLGLGKYGLNTTDMLDILENDGNALGTNRTQDGIRPTR